MTKQERELVTKYNRLSRKWAMQKATMHEMMWCKDNQTTVNKIKGAN